MPSPTRPKTVTPEQPAITDELAQDAAADGVEYPHGTPELRPVLRMPRRERPAYYNAMAEVSSLQKNAHRPDGSAADPEADDRPMEIRLTEVARQAELIAAIEDLLAVVAADEPGFRVWALEVEDSTLVQVFNVYIRKTQPGEAQSSAG